MTEQNLERDIKIREIRETEEKSLAEIGKEFGITRERVRQICKGVTFHRKKRKEPIRGVSSLSLIERLERFIEKSESCWKWVGSKTSSGYGNISFKHKHIYAHRAIWIAVFGEIPSGLCVCHTCDNPGCVNPSHLFLGTMKDNMLDRDRKGRSRYGKANKLGIDRI